jgi:hypothetical protein
MTGGIPGAMKRWVWLAKEDPASAFRAGVLMTFGFLALLSCLFAIAFAVTTLIQSGARPQTEPAARSYGRRSDIQYMLLSPKLGIEERAITSTVLSCIDTAIAAASAAGPREPAASDEQVRKYEASCAGKLVTEVAIAHGGERGQKIVWELQKLGIELPPEYR